VGDDGTSDGKPLEAALGEMGCIPDGKAFREASGKPPESGLDGKLLGKSLGEPDHSVGGKSLKVGSGELEDDLDDETQARVLGEPSRNPSVCDQIKSLSNPQPVPMVHFAWSSTWVQRRPPASAQTLRASQ